MKITMSGLGLTERYLSVGLIIEETAWTRFGLVKVPVDELLSTGLIERMDNAVRRRLIEAWSEVDVSDPLF